MEKLKRLSKNCGPELVDFFGLMISSMSDVRTELEVDSSLEKDVRLCTIKLLQEFIDKIKLVSTNRFETEDFGSDDYS